MRRDATLIARYRYNGQDQRVSGGPFRNPPQGMMAVMEDALFKIEHMGVDVNCPVGCRQRSLGENALP